MSSKPHINDLIPKQPYPVVSYLISGKLLHVSVALFIAESVVYYHLMNMAIQNGVEIWRWIWGICFLFSFAHIFLVLADGWSRFQDYKRAKDQLFMYGFQLRIINQYASSQCQRIAFATAASELGFGEETKDHFYALGYRWFHLIPDFMMDDPFFFYKRYFWRRTFLEKNYTPKFNYRKLSMELHYK